GNSGARTGPGTPTPGPRTPGARSSSGSWPSSGALRGEAQAKDFFLFRDTFFRPNAELVEGGRFGRRPPAAERHQEVTRRGSGAPSLRGESGCAAESRGVDFPHFSSEVSKDARQAMSLRVVSRDPALGSERGAGRSRLGPSQLPVGERGERAA